MEQHRLADRLVSYWNNTRKDEKLPPFAKFNASAIADIMPQCVLFTIIPGAAGKPATVSFYQIGEGLKSIYGSNLVGTSVMVSQRHFQGASIVKRIEDVLADPQPISDQGQFVTGTGKVVKYRSCLLPFGSNGQVTHVIAGLSWREF